MDNHPFTTKIVLKISVFLIALIFEVFIKTTMAQETGTPYTARTYFAMLKNETYQYIRQKADTGGKLTGGEQTYLQEYEAYLQSFYDHLSDSEKRSFLENRQQWEEEYDIAEQTAIEEIEPKKRPPNLGRKFMLSNGIYGFFYGIGALYVLNIETPLGIAVPFISAGVSLSFPLINPKRYDGIDFSTVLMARHGKFTGMLDGAALGYLIFGDPEQNDYAGRAIVALTIASSIALGEAGFQIGRKRNYAEGEVASMRYYGLLTPYLAFSGLVAGNVDDPRIYGATVIAANAAGHYLGDRIYNRYAFTRGDMLAASSFGLLSTGFGFGISPMEEPWHMLIPAATAIGGTVASHVMLNKTQFSSRQGWNINYATMTGTAAGFLAVLVIQPAEGHHLPLLIPSALGFAGWAIYTLKYTRQQRGSSAGNHPKKWANLSLNFTPQNYFLNKKMPETDRDGRPDPGLPLFSVSIRL